MTRPLSSRRAFLPLVPLYRLALALRRLRPSPAHRLRYPVISVGSLSAGGSGKTPTTIALAKALHARGLHVDVLSRGYGRRSKLAMRVEPGGSAEEFGDEPLLIARQALVPVFVGAERYQAGLLAESATRDTEVSLVHLLDDGFQHRQLHRDVNVLLIDTQDFEDHLLPAGNLREPLSAVARAQIIAVPAGSPELEAKLRTLAWQGTIWRLTRRMEVPLIDGPVVAFCGIARSQQFFTGLEAAGLHLASRIAFPDHHRFLQHDLDCILDAARSTRATGFVTTEKDHVRLGKLGEGIPLKTAALYVEIENEQVQIEQLAKLVSSRP